MARARRSGSLDLKTPEPTKIASAPSCIMSAASAGVAIPPAEKFGTGGRRFAATQRSRSYGAPSGFASVMSSSGPSAARRRIPVIRARMCRTASTMLPDPASPLVRIIAAPSPMRRSASPRSRAPQTKGTRNASLSMWKCSSAGVRTSDPVMNSTAAASRICASTKWPMRALAITGMLTVCWISRILLTAAMRATPPSRRMSEGTRSSAMTDAAPACSAIRACSALVTSMMTPPFSISARPMCLGSAILRPFTSLIGSLSFSFMRAKARSHYQCLEPLGRRAGTPAPPPVGDRLGESLDTVLDPPLRHRGERQPRRPVAAAVHEEARSGREADAAAQRSLQERGRITAGRQREQQRETPARFRPAHALRHVALERLEQRRPPPVVLPRDPSHVPVQEAPLAEAVHRRLDERARTQIGELLGRLQPLDHGRRRHEPAEPKAREQHLREGADVQDESVPIERPKRERSAFTVVEAPVKAILDDRHMMARRHVQHPPRRLGCHRQPGRVVRRRLAVEELWAVPSEHLLERLGGRALPVPGDRDQLSARRPEHVDCTWIGRLLDGDDITGIEERPSDQVEALLRSVDDEDVVLPRLHAEPQEIRHQVLAKRRIAIASRRILEEGRALRAHHLVQHPAKRVGREHPAVGSARGEGDEGSRAARKSRPPLGPRARDVGAP